jgi:hypothetical protein
LGFVASAMDTSLFVYRNGDDIAYLLLYVDDIVTSSMSSHSYVASLVCYGDTALLKNAIGP